MAQQFSATATFNIYIYQPYHHFLTTSADVIWSSSELSSKINKCLSLLVSLILPYYLYILLKLRTNCFTHLLQSSIDFHYSQTKINSCLLFLSSTCSLPSCCLLNPPVVTLTQDKQLACLPPSYASHGLHSHVPQPSLKYLWGPWHLKMAISTLYFLLFFLTQIIYYL